MLETEARQHLQSMMRAVQRLRSIAAEKGRIALPRDDDGVIENDESVAAIGWPWIWGRRCVLPTLTKVLDGEHIDKMTFVNLMKIALEFEPLIGAVAGMEDLTFPVDVDINWMRGWDE